MSATILPSPRVDVIPDRWDRLPALALKSGSHTPPTGDGAPQACVRAYLREHPITLPAEVTELAEQQRGAALELLARLIDPTQDGAS